MSKPTDLLRSIEGSPNGLSLNDLLVRHPDIARRTAQRWLSQLIDEGKLAGLGAARARRYVVSKTKPIAATGIEESFPSAIPLSSDSLDILAYIDQPLEARKPVGYQRDFLDTYEPNRTWYLPEPLRRQLQKMGRSNKGLPSQGGENG